MSPCVFYSGGEIDDAENASNDNNDRRRKRREISKNENAMIVLGFLVLLMESSARSPMEDLLKRVSRVWRVEGCRGVWPVGAGNGNGRNGDGEGDGMGSVGRRGEKG